MHCNPAFIGHGSPMNAISDNAYTKFLHSYAQSMPTPNAIVVISAHWQTKGTYITGNLKPKQIFDFWGFPDELYKTIYEPDGSPGIAKEIHEKNIGIQIDDNRGIDHAGWAIVKHMYPKQDIPLLEMSLDVNKTEKEHFELGTKLTVLCDRGILIIGSGNIVHNLAEITFTEDSSPFRWAIEADNWIKDQMHSGSLDALMEYKKYMPKYARSIPTNEHYLPLLYILGMKAEKNDIKTIYEEIQNGSISMRSICIE